MFFWHRRILIYADFIDPFCYVGFHSLRQAAGSDWRLEWRGFELNPDTPGEGMALETAGNSEVQIGQWASVRSIGVRAGLFLKQPPFVPNTRLAHSLVLGVQRHVKIPLIERIYQAYFSDQSDIGSIAVLADLAGSFGVSVKQVEAILNDGSWVKKLETHRREAMKRQFPGMPGFVRGWNKIYFGALSQKDWEKEMSCSTK